MGERGHSDQMINNPSDVRLPLFSSWVLHKLLAQTPEFGVLGGGITSRVGTGEGGGVSGGGGAHLLLSAELIRVAEEEDRRLLMSESPGCFRFMVDVQRLSTGDTTHRQRQGEGRGTGGYSQQGDRRRGHTGEDAGAQRSGGGEHTFPNALLLA